MNLDPWHDLFLATAGAGSALAGLIIVAMSVNITTILAIPSMTSRAASTVAVLVLIVVVACAALVPGQPARVLGAEIAVAAAVAGALALRSARQIVADRPPEELLVLSGAKASLGLVPTTGALIGGLLISAEVTGGLYVTAAAVIVGFATTVTNAWVLLVEVLR